jgi:VanZ family protein
MNGLPQAAVRHEATQPLARWQNVLWYWLPAVAWMAMVLAASSDPFSARNTGEILYAVLAWSFGQVDAATFGLLHFLVRKSAHFTAYAILSALWFRALRVGLPTLWQIRWALIGLIISLSVAILDELHQSWVPSRTSSARDVLLDFCGALFAQILIWYALRRRALAAVEP